MFRVLIRSLGFLWFYIFCHGNIHFSLLRIFMYRNSWFFNRDKWISLTSFKTALDLKVNFTILFS